LFGPQVNIRDENLSSFSLMSQNEISHFLPPTFLVYHFRICF
jgi:hypothetical protein